MDPPKVSSDPERGSFASDSAAASDEKQVDGPSASPLHEAVLSRRPDKVREILTTNKWSCLNLLNVCLVTMLWPFRMMNRRFKFDILHWMMVKRDNDGMCAIHVAAKLGYGDIIDEFLSLWPECVYIRSKHYKTALHVAIKYKQLEVVKKLLANQKPEDGRKMVSSDHDKDGNTAFHIAAIQKVQPEIVEELLRWPAVKLNAMNREGVTPLDIALHYARTAGFAEASPNISHCVRIKEILEEVGACRSTSLPSDEDNESKTLEVDTLVASLIATMTFAAIFQVPGGIGDEEAAKLALDPYFKVFLFCDILALFTSLIVVVAWLFRERLQIGISVYPSRLPYLSALSLGISVTCAGIAFVCATFLVVIPPHVKNLNATHKKEFGEYKGLYSIMTASVLLPFTISIAAVYFCFVSDLISRRLTDPSPRHYFLKRRVFSLGSLVMSVSVALIFQYYGRDRGLQ